MAIKLKGQEVFILSGGVNYRLLPAFIKNSQCAKANNMVFHPDRIEQRSGYHTIGTTANGGVNPPLDGAVMYIDQFYKLNGDSWLLIMTLDKVYRYDTTADDYVDITTATEFTGDEDDPFTADILNDTYIFCNGIDQVRKWTGAGNTGDIAGSPQFTTAKIVRAYSDRLVFFDTTEGGAAQHQRVRWTSVGTIETFTGGTSGFVDLVDGVDWITGAEILGTVMVIYKERSLTLMRYSGATTVFKFTENVISGVGTPAGATIANLGTKHIFMGWDNVYMFDGYSLTVVGDPIRDVLVNHTNPKYLHRSFAVFVEEDNRYNLFVPSTSATKPDIGFSYNYIEDTWAPLSMADTMTSAGYYQRASSLTMNALTGTIDEQLWRFDDRFLLESAPSTLYGDDGGNIYEQDYLDINDDGNAISAYFETKDFYFKEFDKRDRLVELRFEAKGADVDIEYSTDGGVNWAGKTNVSLENTYAEYKYFVDIVARQFRFRFSNPTAGESFAVSWLQPFTILRERDDEE